MLNEFVIIRAREAGIHCGELSSIEGRNVILKDGRRIWRWQGANTLHELANHGASKNYTRISEPLPKYMVLEVCEILPCSKEAEENLKQSRWG